MQNAACATAIVLATVFAAAAIAKLRDREGTRATFLAFGLPSSFALAVPLVEITLAVGLLLVPGWAGIVATALLAGFTTFLVRAVRRGVVAPCNCFGQGGLDRPVSYVEVARNVLLAGAAVLVATSTGPSLLTLLRP